MSRLPRRERSAPRSTIPARPFRRTSAFGLLERSGARDRNTDGLVEGAQGASPTGKLFLDLTNRSVLRRTEIHPVHGLFIDGERLRHHLMLGDPFRVTARLG